MALPAHLHVLDRAGVTTGRVVQLHPLTGEVLVSSGDNEAWNYKQLSDNSQYEALQGYNEYGIFNRNMRAERSELEMLRCLSLPGTGQGSVVHSLSSSTVEAEPEPAMASPSRARRSALMRRSCQSGEGGEEGEGEGGPVSVSVSPSRLSKQRTNILTENEFINLSLS